MAKKTRLEKAEEMSGLTKEDVQGIGTRIFKRELTEEQIIETLERVPKEAEDDPTGAWYLWIENILYQILDT